MKSKTSIPNLFVVGTDTGVGKSVVCLLLMQWLFARGHTPFYVKPFQTGCMNPYDTDSDAAFVYRHTAQLRDKDPAQSVVCCYPAAKAPYFAARSAGGKIDLDKVMASVADKGRGCAPLVVEAAGGLLVPVTRQAMVVDLAGMLHCRLLLVARAGLGTINHTLLSLEALHHRKIAPCGIILVESADAPTDRALLAENISAIEDHSKTPVAGVVAVLKDFSNPSAAAYDPLYKISGANQADPESIPKTCSDAFHAQGILDMITP